MILTVGLNPHSPSPMSSANGMDDPAPIYPGEDEAEESDEDADGQMVDKTLDKPKVDEWGLFLDKHKLKLDSTHFFLECSVS